MRTADLLPERRYPGFPVLVPSASGWRTTPRSWTWKLDFGNLQDKLLAVVNALFAVLVILGIVADPTTESMKDSQRAPGYEKPRVDGEQNSSNRSHRSV